MLPVCPWNGHRKGNSKGSFCFSMHCPTGDAEYLDLEIFSHKDMRVLHYLVAPLGCSVRATASNRGESVKCCQLGWDYLAKDTAQNRDHLLLPGLERPLCFQPITKASLTHTNDLLMRHFTFHYWTFDLPLVQTLIFPSTVQLDTLNKSKHSAQQTPGWLSTALKDKSCTPINISELHVNKQACYGSVKITEPCSKTFDIAGEVKRVCSVSKNQVDNFCVCSCFQLHLDLFQLKMKLELMPIFFFYPNTFQISCEQQLFFSIPSLPLLKGQQKTSSDSGSAPAERTWSLAMSTGASVLKH